MSSAKELLTADYGEDDRERESPKKGSPDDESGLMKFFPLFFIKTHLLTHSVLTMPFPSGTQVGSFFPINSHHGHHTQLRHHPDQDGMLEPKQHTDR
jgi:hypothetical protein